MAAAEEYSLEYFKEWNENCRVRQIQKQFEKIAQDAKANGRSVDEELKEQNFKDYAALAKSCPQFSLTCWPRELAELGSGFVLYFQFLAFLGCLLGLTLCLQSPAVAAYLGEDWTVGWHWTKWGDMWSGNQDACKCIGSNNGILGIGVIPSTANYGTSCAVWDFADCQKKAASAGVLSPEQIGQWCCSTWCFAKPECHTPEEGKKALWNRHFKGLVRATTSCAQDAAAVAQCSAYPDVAFNEPGTDTGPKNEYIGKLYTTPGNFGPDQAEGALIPLMGLVIVASISVLILTMYQHQIYTDAKVDAGTTAPNDFAILVKNLPVTAYDEKALRTWFEANLVKDKTVEIVKVVIGWDYGEFRVKLKRLKELVKIKATLEAGSEEYQETEKESLQIRRDLASAADENASKLRSSGIVVVVFRYQTDMRAALRRWTSFWATWFYCDSEDTCCLPSGNGIWKGAPLPRFPIGDPPRPINQIKVERAANPGDIHWEELGRSSEETMKLFAKTNGIMFLIVACCFGATYCLNIAQAEVKKSQKEKGGIGFQFLSISPALGVAMVNMCLMKSARILGDREYHETWTSQEFSQAAKMAVGLLVNTAGVLFFQNLQPKEWYATGGLVDDAWLILLMDALLPPIIFYFDMKGNIRQLLFRGRRAALPTKIEEWNGKVRDCAGPPTPQKAQTMLGVKNEVEAYKRLYENSEMDFPRRCANALNTFFCCFFFSPIFPVASLIGIAGLVLQYWIDKYLLLRWYKRPARPYNARLAQFSLRMVKFLAPTGFTLAFWFFLTPTWKDKGLTLFPFLISLAVSAAMTFIPSSILRTLLGLRCLMASQGFVVDDDSSTADYYDCQYLWSKDMKYHKDHFLYKRLPESKNPEFLTPGTETAVDVSDVKSSYGAATAEAADKAGAEGGSELALKGGGKIGVADGPVSYGVTPTTYGAAPPEPVPTSVVPAEPTAPAPADELPAPEPAPVPHAPEPHAPASSKPVWEYETNHGHAPFDNDCQDFIEKKYQDFLRSGGKGKGKGAQITVRSQGKEISVDFGKMTQKLKDSHKIRGIRRQGGD
jgi:hypothetical protein